MIKFTIFKKILVPFTFMRKTMLKWENVLERILEVHTVKLQVLARPVQGCHCTAWSLAGF
jgi:hypothetical protein